MSAIYIGPEHRTIVFEKLFLVFPSPFLNFSSLKLIIFLSLKHAQKMLWLHQEKCDIWTCPAWAWKRGSTAPPRKLSSKRLRHGFIDLSEIWWGYVSCKDVQNKSAGAVSLVKQGENRVKFQKFSSECMAVVARQSWGQRSQCVIKTSAWKDSYSSIMQVLM